MGDDNKEWPNTSQANSQAFTDLVPEFEPGKPWKVHYDVHAYQLSGNASFGIGRFHFF